MNGSPSEGITANNATVTQPQAGSGANPGPGGSSTSLPPTLQSIVQKFTAHNALHTLVCAVNHPFATPAGDLTTETTSVLQDLIQATDQLSHSLSLHSSVAFSNSKFISILRQQTAIAHTLHLSEQNIRQTVDALRTRSGTAYGEDIPFDRAVLVDWAISRLEEWATSVGMETFKDNLEREGRMTVVFGGKVLVLDIDLSLRRSSIPDQDQSQGEGVTAYPRVEVKSLKTSYAVPNGDGSTINTDGSSSLDVLLLDSISAFLVEVQREDKAPDALEAEKLGKFLLSHLKYLMMLDRLAERKEDSEGGGIRWFAGVDELGVALEKFARREADAIASSLALPHSPLDIFLHRSHALPLPFLTSPSLSFLTYLSPRAYLSILRSIPPSQTSQANSSSNLPILDVPFIHLRECLSGQRRPSGVTIATLSLSASSRARGHEQDSYSIQIDGDVTGQPTFLLGKPDIEYTFPQLPHTLNAAASSETRYTWTLDFTSSGRHRGVVMSQSRMREIECVVDPASANDMDSLGMIDFGDGPGASPSWVDLLLNPTQSTPASDKYTTLYCSPSSAHPPLRLRLTTPEEPGFVLEKVPVKNMKEVWAILEIVKEQCWLNETLNGCEWAPEGSMQESLRVEGELPVTEELLQALLDGTYTPDCLPIEVCLLSSSNHSFTPTDLSSFAMPQGMAVRQPPGITMVVPERLPISGLVEIVVSYDLTRPKGVRVDVGGGMGMGIGVEGSGVDIEALEEVCRRGGLFSLGGRVWKASDGIL